jgi:HK97 gp10 family phage protein
MNVSGIKELSDRLEALGDLANGREVRAALLQAALPGVNAIKAAAPVGSEAHKTFKGRVVAPGFLSRNIRRKALLRTSKGRSMVIIGPANEAFYATFLEHGTQKMAAQPFMEAAFKSAMPAMINRFKERLARQIERASRR